MFCVEVEYNIHGKIWPGVLGTYMDPPESDEVQITEVERYDPLTGEPRTVPEADWPFDEEELVRIEQALVEAFHREADEGPDPPDDEDFL